MTSVVLSAYEGHMVGFAKTSEARMLANCAVVGAILFAPKHALADATSPTIVVYSPDGSLIPQYRTWTGFTWSGAGAMPLIVFGNAHWMVAHNCPTRDETACVLQDDGEDLFLTFFDGSSWSGLDSFGSNTAVTQTIRGYDIAYENTGDLLIAYWNENTNQISYRTAKSEVLSPQQDLDIPGMTECRWLELDQIPLHNRIMLVAGDSSRQLHAAVWRGNTWGAVETLSTNIQSSAYQCFDVASESQSKRPMVAYSNLGESIIRFQTLDYLAWSGEQIGPTLGAAAFNWIRLVSDPTSDTILCLALNTARELYAARWDGASWSGVQLLVANLRAADRRNFDVAFEADGGRAVVAYAPFATNLVSYTSWSGGVWSAVQSGPSFGNRLAWVALSPATSGSLVFVLSSDNGDDLESVVWNGAAVVNRVQITGSLEGDRVAQSFIVAPARVAGPQIPEEDAPVRVVTWDEVDPNQ